MTKTVGTSLPMNERHCINCNTYLMSGGGESGFCCEPKNDVPRWGKYHQIFLIVDSVTQKVFRMDPSPKKVPMTVSEKDSCIYWKLDNVN